MTTPYRICTAGCTSRGHHAFCECGKPTYLKTSPEGLAIIARRRPKATHGHGSRWRVGSRQARNAHGEEASP